MKAISQPHCSNSLPFLRSCLIIELQYNLYDISPAVVLSYFDSFVTLETFTYLTAGKRQ